MREATSGQLRACCASLRSALSSAVPKMRTRLELQRAPMRIVPFWMIQMAIAWVTLAQVEAPSPEDWRVERQEWTWQVDPGASIRIDNPWGDIAIRAHDLPEVYLLANSQRHRNDPRALDLTVVNESKGFSADVDFEEKDLREEPLSWAKRRADLTVFVPENPATQFSTDKGVLEIRGTRGPTHARSVSGDIRLRIYGATTATTDHGDVMAQFLRTDWPRPAEITTSTGSIRVEMPQGGSAQVEIETRGEITSDYSMEVERVSGTQLKRARISAGKNGPRLNLRSNQGAIQFVESLVPEETDEEQNNAE